MDPGAAKTYTDAQREARSKSVPKPCISNILLIIERQTAIKPAIS